MVDLDSDPTKLIEIVEIGKQLLITRGALTTFSIANDIAKYFAIIPAMFAAVYPGLDTLNIMRLHSPTSAILSAVIFNALIIVALIPLALRGVRYRPASAAAMLRRNLLRLRPRRHHRPVHRHQAHRPASSSSSQGSRDAPTHLARPAPRRAARAARPHRRCSASPTRSSITGDRPDPRPAATRPTARWSPPAARPSAASLIGQAFTDDDGNPLAAVLPVPALRGRRRLRPDRDLRVATSARRTSSTPCPTRRSRTTPARRACSPRSAPAAWPSASWKASTAPGRTAPPTASARCWPCSTATALDRPGHPRGQRQPGLPGHAVRRHLPGRRRSSARQFGEDYSPRRGHPDPRRRARPTRPCPPTRSPPAAAASTRDISPAYAELQAPGWRKARGVAGRPRSQQLIDEHTDRTRRWASSASRRSTCSSSTWPSTSSTRTHG